MQAAPPPKNGLYGDRLALERISHVLGFGVDGVAGAIWGERRHVVRVCRNKRNAERETKEAQG